MGSNDTVIFRSLFLAGSFFMFPDNNVNWSKTTDNYEIFQCISANATSNVLSIYGILLQRNGSTYTRLNVSGGVNTSFNYTQDVQTVDIDLNTMWIRRFQ